MLRNKKSKHPLTNKRRIIKKLENSLVYGNVELVIPYPLLPVVWQKYTGNHNLILRLTPYFNIQAVVEGTGRGEIHSITRTEAKRILVAAANACKIYSGLLNPFKEFLDLWAENPKKSRSGIKTSEKLPLQGPEKATNEEH